MALYLVDYAENIRQSYDGIANRGVLFGVSFSELLRYAVQKQGLDRRRVSNKGLLPNVQLSNSAFLRIKDDGIPVVNLKQVYLLSRRRAGIGEHEQLKLAGF